MKYRGVAYYPEYWPEERWDEDIRLMREAHINLVRVGEFAWAAMEPAEGQFTLEWLHRLVRKMEVAGIDVMLCTPTATPPAWLTQHYPDVCLGFADGHRMVHGIRRHYCPTHQVYRHFSRRISYQLSHDFNRYANVVAWQLDNEFGPERGSCYCPNCQAQFRVWLRQRYGSLDSLNAAWQTRFWSVEYSDWEQVRLAHGDVYSSAKLDTRRFMSDCYIDFAREQTHIIRANHPEALVVTNGMGPIFGAINYYEMFDFLDRACDDLYFDIATMDGNAMAMDIYRNYKPGTPYWITETGSGALSADKVPAPGQLRAWGFSALARGSEAHCIFRWRTALSGQEQELQGVLEYSGRPRRRYAAVQKLFGEFAALAPRVEAMPLPQAEVALIHDYQTLWGYDSSRINEHVKYHQRVQFIYKALYDANVMTDVISPTRELDGYKVVILPPVMMADEEFGTRLRAFIAAGGTVISYPQLFLRDQNDNYLPACAPVGLTDLFGMRVEGGMYLRSFVAADEALWIPDRHSNDLTPGVSLNLQGEQILGHMSGWMEDIELEGGTQLGHFTDADFTGCPALVEMRHNAGRTLYFAGFPDDALFRPVLAQALDAAGVSRELDTPEYVEAVRRGDYLFLINHRADPVTIPIHADEVLVGDYLDGAAHLQGYDVCLLRSVKSE